MSAETPTTVGDDVLIGHLAHLEGCTVKNGAFIGAASLLLHRVVIGEAPWWPATPCC
jgi:carbonic anhydrase/acetyltransferase-like protein (isoleucine patch superfamily)